MGTWPGEMNQFPEDIYNANEEDVEACFEDIEAGYEDVEDGSSITKDPGQQAADSQLPVKQLLSFHRMIRTGQFEKEKKPLMEDLDPVREFYRKLELDRMYEERLYECGMGPMPEHVKKERELHPEKVEKDNFFNYLALF